MSDTAIDSTATEVPDNGSGNGNGHSTEVAAPAPQHVPATAPQLAVAPRVTARDLVSRLDLIKEAMQTAMIRDVDYGVIPGTDKPALFKPGAEKLGVLFELDMQPRNEKIWGPDDHLTVSSVVTVFHAPTGARMGSGEGMCSTREKKYGKRQALRKCPGCDETTVFRSKHPPRDNPDAEPGWFCWKKKGGCGANFAVDDESIAKQEVGEIDNPDLPDTWNTVVKMAQKRARVDAALAVTGASALFTQDVEDDRPPPQEASTSPKGNGAASPPPAEPEPRKPDDLPEDEVNALGSRIGQIGVSFRRLGVLFSSIGAERPAINRADSLRKALRALTPDQAKKLEEKLSDEADRRG